jgi:hypothetical protein
MLRTVSRWVGVSGVAVVLMGCPKKPGAGDAGAGDAGSAATAAVEAAAPANLGANDGDVTKYADQNTDNNDALSTRMTANARTEIGATGGKLVATLKPHTDAVRIADHENYDLVVFPDPADATRKLEGWVAQGDFGAVPSVAHFGDGGAAPPSPSPGNGLVCVKQNPPGKCAPGYSVFAAVCRVPCTTAATCAGPSAKCNGGFCYNANGCGD